MKSTLKHLRVFVFARVVFTLAIGFAVAPLCGMQSDNVDESTVNQSIADDDPVLKDAIETLERHQVPLTLNGMRGRLELMNPDHPSRREMEKQAIALVDRLNSKDYLVRENATRILKLMDSVPQPQLAVAANSSDPEVAYRARAILEFVSSRSRRDTQLGIIDSVCVVVQANQIKGMTDVLMETLLLVDDPISQGELYKAIAVTVEQSDLEKLRAGLQSENDSLRIASAIAILNLLGVSGAKELEQFLESEKNDRVRIAIARSLANVGMRSSLPILIELLASDELKIRVESIQVLRAVTDQRFEFVAYDDRETRQASAEKWQAWVAKNGNTATLHFPILTRHLAVGRILYADYKLNTAVEVDMNGKKVWSVDIEGAWNTQGLPNGNRLVSSYAQRTVIEFDREGNEVWKLPKTESDMMGLHRLDNGNTLVGRGKDLIEYQRDGTVVWESQVNGRVSSCQRLDTGNTLVSLFDKNLVVEINPKGETVWSIETGKNPMSAHRTFTETTLIAVLSDPVVREYDRGKRVIWDYSLSEGNEGNSGVLRLPNGDTLINSRTEIHLVSPDKKVRWSIKGLEHSFGLSVY